MVNLIKLFPMLIYTIYAYCIPQIVDMNIPYNKQEISTEYNEQNVFQENGLLNLVLTETGGGTGIKLDNKIQYGNIDVTMKVAKGNSIVSAFILFSDENQDEVDFEFVQNKNYPNRNIQTTFYYRGIPLYDVNDLYIDTGIDLAYSYNKYTIIWDKEFYEWRFNDKFLRRTYKKDTKNYPDSLSNIKISIWEHVPSNWSGPAPNFTEGPFILSISSITVTCQENSKNTQSPTPTSITPTSITPTSITPTSITYSEIINNSKSYNKFLNYKIISIFLFLNCYIVLF